MSSKKVRQPPLEGVRSSPRIKSIEKRKCEEEAESKSIDSKLEPGNTKEGKPGQLENKNLSKMSTKKGPRTPTEGSKSSPRISAIQQMKAKRRAEMAAAAAKLAELEAPATDNREGKQRGKTALVHDPDMEKHRCEWDPNTIETPARTASIMDRCGQLGLVSRCLKLDSRRARDDEVSLYHSGDLQRAVRDTCKLPREDREEVCAGFDDVYLNEASEDAARLAVGGAVDLVDAVVEGVAHNGMGVVRPPGHHAMENHPCGFCVFNNVVIAAKHALNKGVKKVLIVDFDVHHGQGTQFAFYDDPRVLFMSIHRYEHGAFWPHLREGNFDHIGAGAGTGFNVNVPLNATGLGPSEYLAIFHKVLLPIASQFQPELVLVSAGFDAAMGCPEGEMLLTPATYPHIVSSLSCLGGGRTVVLLEGGYCIVSLAESAALTLRGLLGDPCPVIQPTGQVHASVLETISSLVTVLRPHWTCLQCRPSYSGPHRQDIGFVPQIKFSPPLDWPPDKYPTREYMSRDEAIVAHWRAKVQSLVVSTSLNSADAQLAWFYDPDMGRHEDDEPHPECPDRIHRIHAALDAAGILAREGVVKVGGGRKLVREEANLVHHDEHWENMEDLGNKEQSELDEMAEKMNSIYMNKFSLDCALLAAGGVLDVVDSVLLGKARAGLGIVRPPGHHAEPHTPHGFCFFNNVAIAAQYAVSVHGLSKVLVLDWDVHHGNGIQHMFYESSNVLYISVHRFDYGMFFPGSDDAGYDKVGENAGKGFNINIPFNGRGHGDAEYLMAFLNVVLPVAYEFQPELVLVASGFDAARGDPLGGFKVSPEMYGYMTHWLTGLAGGRVVVALEGGYNLNSISESCVQVARGLVGDPIMNLVQDGNVKGSAMDTINSVMEAQAQYWKCLEGMTVPVPESMDAKVGDGMIGVTVAGDVKDSSGGGAAKQIDVKDSPGGGTPKQIDVKESSGGGATKQIDGEVDRLGDILRDLGLEMTQVFDSGVALEDGKPTGDNKGKPTGDNKHQDLNIKMGNEVEADIPGERRNERAGNVSIASDENEFDIMEGELEPMSSSILDSTFESSLALEVSDSSHGSYTLDNSDIQDIDSPGSLHYGACNKTI